MEENRNQREINNEEWHNPDNWSGNLFFQGYFSKRDSRLFVPMFFNSRLMPTTLNFGHRWGFAFAIFTGICSMVITALIGWMVARQ